VCSCACVRRKHSYDFVSPNKTQVNEIVAIVLEAFELKCDPFVRPHRDIRFCATFQRRKLIFHVFHHAANSKKAIFNLAADPDAVAKSSLSCAFAKACCSLYAKGCSKTDLDKLKYDVKAWQSLVPIVSS